jgi:hypothetical protein
MEMPPLVDEQPILRESHELKGLQGRWELFAASA